MIDKKRYILLAGAPESDALIWDECGLLSSFSIPSRNRYNPSDPATTSCSSSWPKWRAVHLDCDQLQAQQVDAGVPTQFLSFGTFDAAGVQQVNQDFLDRSVALLDDVHPSQLANVDITAVDNTSISNNDTSFANTSFMSGDTSIGATETEEQPPSLEVLHPVTDIKRIPSAATIDKIAPQTVTINLIAGVISVSLARTVKLRRRNTEMDIVEVIVGDETRAGFAISVWLVPVDSQRPRADDLRERLRSLRGGDIVLISNVALSTFRGCVYGQSLSRRLSKNSTTIKLVTNGQEPNSNHAMLLKVKRVQAWADNFVGNTSNVLHGGTEAPRTLTTGHGKELLPPDTQ